MRDWIYPLWLLMVVVGVVVVVVVVVVNHRCRPRPSVAAVLVDFVDPVLVDVVLVERLQATVNYFFQSLAGDHH